MLSTAVTISIMDPSSQEVEDTEASTPLNPFQQDGCPSAVGAPSCWLLFFKPIAAIGVGTLLFGSGTTWSLLYFTQVGNVPYLLGPLLLSVGLMFLVTGLVWIPMLKQSLEHHALTKVNHGKGLQVEHRHH
ncbi:phosphoinositide-interacting protein-like [Chaetodon trifascialis]|uniref:phosphoinositide-interacting protein-like n=1 Tax=Chaetodon trifascialis TaxID=109706 RepID=UPI0039956A54